MSARTQHAKVGLPGSPNAYASRAFSAIGTEAVVAVTDPRAVDLAAAMLRVELRALDNACSRFRPDAEIDVLAERTGEWVAVSDVLYDAIETACNVARLTAGAVDPTVRDALERLGYDRDFASLEDHVGWRAGSEWAEPAPGWWNIDLDPAARRVRANGRLRLDLGSSAKARAADRGAAHIAARLGVGVLVSLGGDIAVAGPAPESGWPVGVAAGSSAAPEALDELLVLRRGALASSAPGVRAWRRGGVVRHHIVDPSTGRCAPACWRLVSVLAPTCVEANALSTASIVWGEDAPDRLAGYGRAARLVHDDGTVVVANGWPVAGSRHETTQPALREATR